MSNALYLEHYLDSLEHLPTELRRNFELMRNLDDRTQTTTKEIDKLADDYLKNAKKESQEKKNERLAKIQFLFNRAKGFGDDKVQLAIQTYELVDKHIRRLDSDLSRFESAIQEQATNNNKAQEESGATKKGRKKLKEKERKKKGTASSEDESKGTRRKQKKGTTASAAALNSTGSGSQGDSTALSGPADVLDMPVDPNEPTYCVCNQVSYGEMIGCDNPDCGIEWFHFACVGLTTKPKGRWFCPKCTQDRKKK